MVEYAPDAWRVLRGNRATIQKWTQAAAKVGKWGRFLGKVSGVASIAFGAVDAYQGYQKFRSKKGYRKWAGLAQSLAGAMTTIGGIALLTGAGAPVAGVAFGVAAVASGVSAVLEIAGDPQKRQQVQQAVARAGEKMKEMGGQVKEKVQQVGQAVGTFLHKAGGWLGNLVGGRS